METMIEVDRDASIKRVFQVCKQVLKLSIDDLNCCREMAKEQIEYTHPLKNGKAYRLSCIGENNMRIISLLKKLQKTIKNAEKF